MRVPGRGSRLVVLLGLLFTTHVLAGCAAPEMSPSPAPAAITLDDRLSAALRDRDRSVFVSLFDDTAPGRRLAGRVWSNLIQLGRVDISAPDDQPGAADNLIALDVRWAAPGERATADHRLVVRVDRSHGPEVIVDAALTGRVPIWWLEPVSVIRVDRGALIASRRLPETQLDNWRRALAKAVAMLKRSGITRTSPAWDSTLVVEIPFEDADFDLVCGVRPGSQSVVAGSTLTQGDADGAATRVIINPSPQGRAPTAPEAIALVVHEGVHAVTRAAESRAPAWMKEGLADLIMTEADPSLLGLSRDDAERALAERGLPEALPSAGDFETGSADLAGSYALARIAVAELVRHLGRAEAFRFIAASNSGWPESGPTEATVTRWYAEALKKL